MLIEEYPGLLAADLCAGIIGKFEADSRKGPSTIGNAGQISNYRTGTLLRVNEGMADWLPTVQAVLPSLHAALDRYADKYEAVRTLVKRNPLSCTYPLIERVDPGQGFDWHYDQNDMTAERAVACLLYLNDVKAGGATEFKHVTKRIQPRAGKIALFPPYWSHLHRGISPTSGPKYVLSCFWVYAPRPAHQIKTNP